ncbi:M56 family metallopeptidase [Saccharibacillus brassicae]|uniref:M56 family metallopeptidase n=1 Tax=Saccharibacillus brassicae TaxID=2583377 RepID=UPI0014796FE3|nr:M56 family metallopeptidase [Saccharibacillus brassicae]
MLNALGELFRQVLLLSAAASVTALLILLVRIPLKNRLHPRWIYLLWSLLLLRLLLPWTPESPISVYNWLPGLAQAGPDRYAASSSPETASTAADNPDYIPGEAESDVSADSAALADGGSPAARSAGEPADGGSESGAAGSSGGPAASAQPGGAGEPGAAADGSVPGGEAGGAGSAGPEAAPGSGEAPSRPAAAPGEVAAPPATAGPAAASAADDRGGLGRALLQGFALLWLLGAAAALAFGLSAHARFAARLRQDSAAPPPEAERLLQTCRREMRLRRPVRLEVTGQVGVPTLLGAVRPRLLLPPQVLTELDESQLRHVMLHELAHAKRLDVPVNLLAALLTALHLFNPLLAYAFRRMREDQEVACDALAMKRLEPDERLAYGRTIVRLLDSMAVSAPLPGAVGLSGGKTEIKRRLILIATPRTQTYRSAIVGAAVMLLLGGCTLTGAKWTEPSAPTAAAGDSALPGAQLPGTDANSAVVPLNDPAETLLIEENSIRVTSRETSEGGQARLIHVGLINGDQARGRSYLWDSSNDPGHPPRADWADVNDDGIKEIVLILDVGSITGQELEHIHVLDPYTLEELDVADYRDFRNNRFTIRPVLDYGGRLYVEAGLNGRYLTRAYDNDETQEDSDLHYPGVAKYEIVRDRIVAHAYGKLSDTKFPVRLTVTYGPDLKPADTVMYPTGDVAPPFTQQEIRERIDGRLDTAQRDMIEQGGLYVFEEADAADSAALTLNYAVNPDTGTIFDAAKGGPIGTLAVIDDSPPPDLYDGALPDLSDLYDEAYETKIKRLLQPILTASRLKKDGEDWVAGYAGDGTVLVNVLLGGDKLTIKADLFTGMWEKVHTE